MKNLFIVRSPLQLINAIEAKEHFQTKHNVLLIIYTKGKPNNAQIDNLLSLSTWDKIIKITPPHASSNIMTYVKLIKKLKKEPYEYIVSGDYGTIQRMIIVNLMKHHVYLVDDGVLSIALHNGILNPNKPVNRPFKQMLRSLRYKFFGLRTSLTDTINWFTCYELIAHGHEKIIANDYHYLQKSFLDTLEEDNTIYLLGQNYIATKILDQKTYLGYIQQIIAHYEGQHIVYIPHRSEIIFDELKALFNDNFTLEPSTGPVETRFLLQGKYPKNISSFNTSALFTLAKIFPECSISSFMLNEKDIQNKKVETLQAFEFLKRTSIMMSDIFR